MPRATPPKTSASSMITMAALRSLVQKDKQRVDLATQGRTWQGSASCQRHMQCTTEVSIAVAGVATASGVHSQGAHHVFKRFHDPVLKRSHKVAASASCCKVNSLHDNDRVRNFHDPAFQAIHSTQQASDTHRGKSIIVAGAQGRGQRGKVSAKRSGTVPTRAPSVATCRLDPRHK